MTDPVTGWLEALDRRHLADLTPSEVARALRALSSCYVERRARLATGGALDSAGKRAAFALFYAPIHFVVARAIVGAIAGSSEQVREVLDVGCGTGTAGAAWALAAGTSAIRGIDRHPWAVAEANWTYRQLGLNGRARQSDASRAALQGGPGTAAIVAYAANELGEEGRAVLLAELQRLHAAGARILVIEPIARSAAPWWNEWAGAAASSGGRVDEWRFPPSLPPRQQALARAAGLDPRELTARSLYFRRAAADFDSSARANGAPPAESAAIFQVESPDAGAPLAPEGSNWMQHPPSDSPPRRGLTLTQQIFVGLAIGIATGWFVSEYYPSAAPYFRPFSQLFLRLIKMVIAPLIFATLVAGIAGAGHVKVVGRMGLRAILYFEVVTTLALVVGLLAVNVMRPGVGVNLPMGQQSGITATPQTWDQILLHVVPESLMKAMADGDVLQIVVFSIFFAIALGMIGEKGRPIVVWCEALAETMFKFTNIVMHYAPIGVGAAIAYTVGHGGVRVLWNLAWLVATLYLALAVFVLAVLLPIALAFGVPIRKFIRAVKEPAIIAFSTTSSEAALPRAMEAIERLGVPRRIVAFVLPLGYSFNLDGTTLYLSLASIFVAQAAGVHLSPGHQITMLLTLMLTSKGVAGVPRASLVILAATLASYGLPLEGVTLILGVDELMDMARTMVNVIGNCLATVVVAKWEGEFVEASDEELAIAAVRGEI